jgi:hypothetical protein
MEGNFKMSISSRRELLRKQKSKYLKASKQEKSKILDHIIQNVEMDRKYVISLLSSKTDLTIKKLTGRKKRAWTYTAQDIYWLRKIWKVMDYPCGQRLAPYIGQMINTLNKFGELDVPNSIAKKLKRISPATIDRRLEKYRTQIRRRVATTTKPGSLLKKTNSN